MLRVLLLILIISLAILFFREKNPIPTSFVTPISPTISPTAAPQKLPQYYFLPNDYQAYQTFNNCGPAALSMALSYYDIAVGQDVLGQRLRPFQNQLGDNDDKSVTLDELGEASREYGFIPYHRPAGDMELVKRAIASGVPVITRTWLRENEDIGHFRVVKGYDDAKQNLLQDDSLQGHDLTYSYELFLDLWKKFNFEYLILIPRDNERLAIEILQEDFDENVAWKKARDYSLNRLSQEPNDIYAALNLSVAYKKLGENQKAADTFMNIEALLPFRTLWYQIEPIEALAAIGEDEKVFSLSEKIINNQNRAYSELYLIRGDIYKKQGNLEAAKEEYEKAVFYNKNLKKAIASLSSVSN